MKQKILESQIETGTPYMLYKDHANKKSNQKNIKYNTCRHLQDCFLRVRGNDKHKECRIDSKIQVFYHWVTYSKIVIYSPAHDLENKGRIQK